MSKKLSQRPWRAHEAQVYELVEDYDDPTNPFKVESSPNPGDSCSAEQERLWANEAQEVADEGGDEEYGWDSEWSDGYEWPESPEYEYHAFDASFSKGKGKKGKSGKEGKRSERGQG